MFKTETHLHTAETSPCGHIGAAEMVKLYHDAGYHTVFISDHFYSGFFDRLQNLSWAEKIEAFLAGYNAALQAGKEYGMNVLLSAEFMLDCSPNHFLLYGIDQDFLNRCSGALSMTIPEFSAFTHENGVTIVQAHPCRDNWCSPVPEYVDAFEVFNTNPRHQNFDGRVLDIALSHDLPITAGSDAHRYEDVAKGCVISPVEIRSAEEYIRLLLIGDLKPEKLE